jgi:hypothetical protein
MTNADVYRAGMLSVPHGLPVDGLQRLLPPEHRIAGISPGARSDRFIIEGASLPPVSPAGFPPSVVLLLELRYDGAAVEVHGSWGHDEAQRWLIDRWADFDAYKRDAILDPLDSASE